jgi:hypothetical protein
MREGNKEDKLKLPGLPTGLHPIGTTACGAAGCDAEREGEPGQNDASPEMLSKKSGLSRSRDKSNGISHRCCRSSFDSAYSVFPA